MDECCRLGTELSKKKSILYETDNFFIVPSLGQMGIEGYLLLCSKQHLIGLGDVPKKHYSELRDVLDKTRYILEENYNSKVLVFEHGPRTGCHKGGGCLDHAHLHLVPTSTDIMKFLNNKFKPEEIDNFQRLKEIYEAQRSSYMFIETQDRINYVIEVDFPIPSQYLRQVIASNLDIKEWDWRLHPDYKTFEKTVEYLKDKFIGGK